MHSKRARTGLMLMLLGIVTMPLVFATGGQQTKEGEAGQVKVVEWVIKDEKFKWTNDLDLWKLVREVANIQVKPILLPPDAAEEKLNIMIATGQIPDIAPSYSNAQTASFKLMGPKGAWMPISDNLKLVPNLNVFVKKYPVPYKKLLAADDKLYFFPTVKTYDVAMTGIGILLRDDLLKKGGMRPEDIKTMEDLEKAFTILKNQLGKPPLSTRDFGTGTKFDAICQMMGTSMSYFPWYNPQSRKYENPFKDNPRTKEALSLLAKWYKSGIIHPDFATHKDKTWEGMLLAGELAIELEKVGRIGDDTALIKKLNPEFSFAAVPWPSHKGKQYPMILSDNDSAAQFGTGLFISNKTNAKQEILRLFNHQYDPENSYMWWMGPTEGVHFIRRPDGTLARTYPITEQAAPENKRLSTEVWGFGLTGYFSLIDEAQLYADRWYERAANPMVPAYAMMQKIPSYEFPFVRYGDAAAEIVELRTNTRTYISENIVKFINNNLSVERDWDTFLQGLEKMGASQLVDLFNKGKV